LVDSISIYTPVVKSLGLDVTAEAISRHLLTVGTIMPAWSHGTAPLRGGRASFSYRYHVYTGSLRTWMGNVRATIAPAHGDYRNSATSTAGH